MLTTAAIVIIGDEILSGMVADCNAVFMARELRLRGVSLRRIAVVPDDIDDIAVEVSRCAAACDYVFTSGGIGPTHDDVSIDGISKAFGVRPVINEDLRVLLSGFYRGDLNPEKLKMATVPEGATLVTDKTLKFPLIRFRNIYIFPGVPEYLREKFRVIAGMFTGPTLYFRKVYINEYESAIAPALNEVVKNHANVKIGSYPIQNASDHMVVLTLESLSERELDSAIAMLSSGVFREKIVRTEG